MAKSYRQILIEARAWIEDPSAWTQHRGASDAMGNSCGPLDDEACAWCATGALCKVTGAEHGRAVNGPIAYLTSAAKLAGFVSAADANDRGGHAIVLAMFDEAIKLAGAKAGGR